MNHMSDTLLNGKGITNIACASMMYKAGLRVNKGGSFYGNRPLEGRETEGGAQRLRKNEPSGRAE